MGIIDEQKTELENIIESQKLALAKRIKNTRIAMGISQTDFAKAIGVSKQTLYKYENAIVTKIPPETIVKIANKFGTTPTELMGWVNTDNADTSINDLEAEIAPFVDMLYKLPTDYRTLALNGIQRVYNMYLNDDTYKGV